MSQYLPRINFFALLAALALFALPWTEIKCNGRNLATQNGVQTIYGGISLDESLEAASERQPAGERQQSQDRSDRTGFAPLVALAGLVVLAGAGLAFIAMTKHTATVFAPGLLAGIALLLLLVQLVIGFPVNREIAKAIAEQKSSDDPPVAVMMDLRADRTTWFYLELLCLAIPAGFYINSRLPRQQPQRPQMQEHPPRSTAGTGV